jgi:acyl-CoA thioester hydrolase
MRLAEGTVRPEWIDYNGHLYDGYYAVIFAEAADAFLDAVGLDQAGRGATGRTIYTLETHVRFLAEMKQGAPYRVDGQILDHDHKRVVLFLTLVDTVRDIIAATSEEMLMSIDTAGDAPRSAPWLPAQAEAIGRLAEEHAGAPAPDGAGRGIGIRRAGKGE